MLPMQTIRLGRAAITGWPGKEVTAAFCANARPPKDSSNGNARLTPAARRKNLRLELAVGY